jgi:predicted glycoside hydrolase/deacetylase ChbG (UPF0249 family)
MKKLIVNADDFGYSREVTDGIVHAHRNGCITSTTLMANMPAWEYAVQLAAETPSLSVGVHLTLTQGYPVLPAEQVPSLVDSAGHFLAYDELARRAWRFQLDTGELVAELSAQVSRLIEAGLVPTHADSHHHATMFPQPFVATMMTLKQFPIRRMRTHRCAFYIAAPDGMVTTFLYLDKMKRTLREAPKQKYYDACDFISRVLLNIRFPSRRLAYHRVLSGKPFELTLEDWERYVAAVPSGISELATHPGYPHTSPEDSPEMAARRVEELHFYSNPQTKAIAMAMNVQLVDYRCV